jgi:hypothetical protein
MEKEINKSKASLLFSKRKAILRECILPFLYEIELLTLAKTSRDLLKATKMHFESWPKIIEKNSKKIQI